MIDRRYIFSILQCLKNQNSNWYDHPHYNTVLLWRGSNRGIIIKWFPILIKLIRQMLLINRWGRQGMHLNTKCVQIKINQIWIFNNKIIQQVSKNILSIKVNRIFIKCTWITYPKAVKQMEEFHNKWIRKIEMLLKQSLK